MKKKLLPLAIAAVMAPGFASAADTSGFVDMTYNIVDDSATPATAPGCGASGSQACLNANEGKFSTNGEIDFTASPMDGATVRLDVDLMRASNAGGSSASLEQAYVAWGVTDAVTIMGGVFNNPIGQEADDAPDLNFTTTSIIRNALDNQTTLYGNNVEGVAVAGAFGPATVTLGLLNDLGGANEENSIALVVNGSPMQGLDLELGIVTHDEDTDGVTTTAETVGDIMDFNVAWMPSQVAGLGVGLDYATFDKIADTAYNFWVKYTIPNSAWTVGLRTEQLSWETGINGGGAAGTNYADTEATTLHVAYQAASNVTIALEVKDGDGVACSANTACTTTFNSNVGATGISQDALTQLELIATF